MKRSFLRGDSKTHSLQKIRQIAVSQMDGSCKKPLASRKSGKSSEGASSSRRPSPGGPLSPKATVSAPQAKKAVVICVQLSRFWTDLDDLFMWQHQLPVAKRLVRSAI